jgi:hypothetical protein
MLRFELCKIAIILKDGFAELGNALKMNRGIVITELDVSQNNMKDKGMKFLSDGIQCQQHLTKIK